MSDCQHKVPCGCGDTPLNTPTPCIPNVCVEEQCSETFSANCVIYTGVTDTCTGTENGMSVTEVIEQLNSVIKPLICLTCPTAYIPANGAIGSSLTPTLSWNPIADATGYTIYLDTVAPPLVIVSEEQSGTSFTVITPLDENTVYYWMIEPVTRNPNTCPIQSFETVFSVCQSPIEYILNYALTNVTDPSTIGEIISQVLNTGIALENCNLCCPTCGDIYALTSLVTAQKLLESGVLNTKPCCLNITADMEAYMKFIVGMSTVSLPPCCNDFTVCTNKLAENVDDYGLILAVGIFEWSTLKDNTGLCELLNILLNFVPTLSPEEIRIIIVAILDTGFIVQCKDGVMLISSYDTFSKTYVVPL